SISHDAMRWAIHLSLYDFVSKLHELPEGHPMAVERSAADSALQVLEYLTNYNDDAPKVFTHGGDAVVFKWDRGEVAQYVTVGGPEVTVLDMHKASPKMQCEMEYNIEDEGQRAALL